MYDINNQKLIYFYSPYGIYTRINKNLELFGLDSNKKVCNIQTETFNMAVRDNKYIEKYKEYDVIYLDEFYDIFIESNNFFDVIRECISLGKQIVMAGHDDLDFVKSIPKDIRKQINLYDLNYDIDWSYDYKIDYIV